jgi:hypothetical protein
MLQSMMLRSPLVAVLTLGAFGCILIWKGITGNVMTTRMGDVLIPRWMYIIGGVALLVFPAVSFLVWWG